MPWGYKRNDDMEPTTVIAPIVGVVAAAVVARFTALNAMKEQFIDFRATTQAQVTALSKEISDTKADIREVKGKIDSIAAVQAVGVTNTAVMKEKVDAIQASGARVEKTVDMLRNKFIPHRRHEDEEDEEDAG